MDRSIFLIISIAASILLLPLLIGGVLALAKGNFLSLLLIAVSLIPLLSILLHFMMKTDSKYCIYCTYINGFLIVLILFFMQLKVIIGEECPECAMPLEFIPDFREIFSTEHESQLVPGGTRAEIFFTPGWLVS